jgi:hypothetical protein
MATAPSPREYSLSLTVTQNEHVVDPRGEPAVLCFGYRFGYWGTPVGPTPAPRPRRAQRWLDRAGLCGAQRQSPNRPIARRCRRRRERQGPHRVRRLRLRRIGGVRRPRSRRRLPCRYTPLHYAARYGNRRMIRLLVDANADVNAQYAFECAVCARGESAVECAGRVAAAVGRAGTRRFTLPRPMAIPHPSRSCCCAAPTGPSRQASGNAALRRTAEPENRSSRARAGTRPSDTRKSMGSSRSTKRE